MSQANVTDNTKIPKEKLASISRLTEKIADKTLGQLESEGIFVFPELLDNADDITKDQMILQSVNNFYQTSNVMGFLGIGSERLEINSRFSSGGHDYLFQYLLERVFDVPNLVDLETDADGEERIFNLLLFVFPHYLRCAMRKGLFKTYVHNSYNDFNVKGTIDIVRHISKNTPFLGNVAYSKREYSFDNNLTELVRHTIEFIKCKSYGQKILSQVKDEVKEIVAATGSYEICNWKKIIDANKANTVRHAFYREYRELQYLCLLILQHQKHQIGFGNRQIYGLLFDGSWLWEEYINLLVGHIFYHPKNKVKSGGQMLFDHNIGQIFPDFISRDSAVRIIADAKYKPIGNIAGKDYLQVLAYMFRFEAKKGFYFYPETSHAEDLVMWLNKGSTYENDVIARNDICVVKHGFHIPASAKSYDDFSEKMLTAEKQFIDSLAL